MTTQPTKDTGLEEFLKKDCVINNGVVTVGLGNLREAIETARKEAIQKFAEEVVKMGRNSEDYWGREVLPERVAKILSKIDSLLNELTKETNETK